MSRYIFKLPDIGEGIAESEIAAWRVAVGDRVSEDQPLVDMLTDKAAVEIPSPLAGIVVELHGAEGDKVAVGAPLIVLDTAASEEITPGPGPGPGPGPAGSSVSGDATPPMASPALRRRAREQGIDLRAVPGSGLRGRIVQADLDAYVAAARAPPVAGPVMAAVDKVETVRIVGLRRKIAEAMQRAKQHIPHFAYVEEIDVTELEALRTYLSGRRGDGQPKLTLLPFLIRALVRVLPQYPQINARYDDAAGLLHRHAAVHLGIATQTQNGLVVPVLRNAQSYDLWQLATEVARLAAAARDGKARHEQLGGSTITLSSLGALGGIVSTPIINAPEVAIIGVNRIVERPVVSNGRIQVRAMMNLSSSFDHRIIDGWDAAKFIQDVKASLERPATLFLP